MNQFYLPLTAFLLFCMLTCAQAQSFRVQIAAYSEQIPTQPFNELGFGTIQVTPDQNSVYRYYIGEYNTREEADKIQNAVFSKGFPQAVVIDLEEQKALCGTPCPWMTAMATFNSTTTDNLFIFPIYFEQDAAAIGEEYQEELDKVSKILMENPTYFVKIIGHADPKGAYEYNLALSKKRVRIIRDHLSAHSIPEMRIKTKVTVAAAADNSADQMKHSEAMRRYQSRITVIVTRANGEIVPRR
jgi:outer membrane protein OmpA-like peptidoglycan-associated protein